MDSSDSYTPPLGLTIISSISIGIAALWALWIMLDIIWRRGWRTMMAIMIPVYIINALYLWPITLWTYLKYGRPPKPGSRQEDGVDAGESHMQHGMMNHRDVEKEGLPTGDERGSRGEKKEEVAASDARAEEGSDGGKGMDHHGAHMMDMAQMEGDGQHQHDGHGEHQHEHDHDHEAASHSGPAPSHEQQHDMHGMHNMHHMHEAPAHDHSQGNGNSSTGTDGPKPGEDKKEAGPAAAAAGVHSMHGHGDMHMHGGGDLPMFANVTIAVCHCGAGCVLGDVLGEWIVYGSGATIAGRGIWPEWLVDFALALAFGIVFQYFSIAPATGDYGPRTLWRAATADFFSLVAFEIGLFGWMAIFQIAIFRWVLGTNTVTYWFMMQIGMFLGHWTAVPVNWWLLTHNVKVAIH